MVNGITQNPTLRQVALSTVREGANIAVEAGAVWLTGLADPKAVAIGALVRNTLFGMTYKGLKNLENRNIIGYKQGAALGLIAFPLSLMAGSYAANACGYEISPWRLLASAAMGGLLLALTDPGGDASGPVSSPTERNETERESVDDSQSQTSENCQKIASVAFDDQDTVVAA